MGKAAKHKHSGMSLTVASKLTRAELADLARAAADSAKGNNWNSPGTVRFEQASGERLDFSVQSRGPVKRELMTFAIMTTAQGETVELTTRIVTFKTMQQKFLGVPLGAKKLLGLAAYRDFIEKFQLGIAARDSRSTANVTGI